MVQIIESVINRHIFPNTFLLKSNKAQCLFLWRQVECLMKNVVVYLEIQFDGVCNSCSILF